METLLNKYHNIISSSGLLLLLFAVPHFKAICQRGMLEPVLNQLQVDAGNLEIIYPHYAPLDSVVLTAKVTGGTGPYAYRWSPGLTTESIRVSPRDINYYIVTVTDVNGLYGMDKVAVCVNQEGPRQHKYSMCLNGYNYEIDSVAVKEKLDSGYHLGTCSWEKTCCNPIDSSGIIYNIIREELIGFDPVEQEFTFLKAFPNPFYKLTTLEFRIGSYTDLFSPVSLKIYDLQGKVIETPFSSIAETNKIYVIEFNPPEPDKSAMYFARLDYNNGEIINLRVLYQAEEKK